MERRGTVRHDDLEGRTDARLMRLSVRDPAAFRQVYERHAEKVYAFHVRRTGDRDAAHDLTAETFARAWFARDRFRDRRQGSAAPWLFGIARNVLLASIETGRIEKGACQRLGIFDRLDRAQAEAAPVSGWGDHLEDVFDALPEAQRLAVRLRVLDDLSYAEVARRLGCSQVAARIRVSRGLSALKEQLIDPMEVAT